VAFRFTTALAITGAIAGTVLTGFSAPAAADTPPGIPTVSVSLTTPTATRPPVIRVDYTVCAGCDLVASWNYGGASPYPTTYPQPTGGNFTDLGQTTPGIIPVAGDELTYHLSFFAKDSNGDLSTPAEWSLNVPEWLGGLAPDPTITAKGSNELNIRVDAADGNTFRRYRTRVYVKAGKRPPGTSSTLPKGKPLLECLVGKCPVGGDGFINLTVHKTKDVGYYSVSTYGTDRAGHRHRLTETEYLGHDGQHVGGLGLVPGAIGDGASMAVDKNGTVHAITPQVATTEYAAIKNVNYLTRKAKAKKWTRTSFPLSEEGGGAVVQSGISSDKNFFWTVFQTCTGLYWAQTPIGATTLSPRTEFGVGGTCALNLPQPALRRAHADPAATPGTEDDPEDIVGVTALPGDELAVLGIDSNGVGTVTTLVPGQPATVTPLLGSGLTTVPQAITRDPVTGELLVVGDQLNPGGQTTGFLLWSQLLGQTWSPAPLPIGQPLTGRTHAVATSITDDAGRIMVGVDGVLVGKTAGIFTIVGSEALDLWTTAAVPYTPASANYLRLTLDPATKKVHAAYDVTTGHGGIREQSWNGRAWTVPTTLSTFHEDLPEALAVGPAHHSVVLYECNADTIVHVDDTNVPGYT
jgi:hypothetical protein